MLIPSISLNPSSAAFPVSPEVAAKINIFLSSLCFSLLKSSKYGNNERAKSLNANVLPWNSSPKLTFSFSLCIGTIFSSLKVELL